MIAIIGILASVVLASLNAARLKARNTARIFQLAQVKKALELYYDDYGAYPTTSGGWYTDCSAGWAASGGLSPNNIIPGLVPKYVARITSDPKFVSGGGSSCTIYISDSKDYKFFYWDLLDSSPGASHFDYSGYPAFRDAHWDGGGTYCVMEGTGVDNTGGQAWQVSTGVESLCAHGYDWW